MKKSFNARVNSPRARPGGSSQKGGNNSPRSQLSQPRQQYAYSPSQSENYSGMYSPRYSNQQQSQQQQQQYYDGGEFDESYFYEDADASMQEAQQVEAPPSAFQVLASDSAPGSQHIQEYDQYGNPVHTGGKKKGRKMGRMSVMESMVPSMYRKKE